jgi:transposase
MLDTWKLDDAKLTSHLYFDPGRHSDLALRFEKNVLALSAKANRESFRNVREAKVWIRENTGVHAACLGVAKDGNGKPQVVTKPNQIAAATIRAGYTMILTHGRDNVAETAENVLQDYRARDTAEKLFDAFKTEDGQYRLRTSNDNSVQGRFFLGFITLILRAGLEKRMRAADLHKSMTTAAVFDELGKIKALLTRQNNRILLEVSKKQRLLLAALKLPDLA